MSRTGLGPETEVAESGAWTKPRCSLQDLPPRGRPAIPRRLNALDREPGCSLQADRCAASDRVAAAVDGCGLPHRDESASNSSDRDRKSTRLNSSHLGISYAVFCLKK